MADLKTLNTKSNEVILELLRVLFMPLSAGIVAVPKYKHMRIAKKQELYI